MHDTLSQNGINSFWNTDFVYKLHGSLHNKPPGSTEVCWLTVLAALTHFFSDQHLCFLAVSSSSLTSQLVRTKAQVCPHALCNDTQVHAFLAMTETCCWSIAELSHNSGETSSMFRSAQKAAPEPFSFTSFRGFYSAGHICCSKFAICFAGEAVLLSTAS